MKALYFVLFVKQTRASGANLEKKVRKPQKKIKFYIWPYEWYETSTTIILLQQQSSFLFALKVLLQWQSNFLLALEVLLQWLRFFFFFAFRQFCFSGKVISYLLLQWQNIYFCLSSLQSFLNSRFHVWSTELSNLQFPSKFEVKSFLNSKFLANLKYRDFQILIFLQIWSTELPKF